MEDFENLRDLPQKLEQLIKEKQKELLDFKHEDFVWGFKNKYLTFIITAKDKYRILYGWRKFVFYFFASMYLVVPVIAIIALTIISGNWWFLTGIAVNFVGVAISAFRKSIIIFIYTAIAVISWIRNGFYWDDYITYFFFCIWCGYFCYGMADGLEEAYAKEIVLENKKVYEILVQGGLIMVDWKEQNTR